MADSSSATPGAASTEPDDSVGRRRSRTRWLRERSSLILKFVLGEAILLGFGGVLLMLGTDVTNGVSILQFFGMISIIIAATIGLSAAVAILLVAIVMGAGRILGWLRR